jgi:hypothetical protein
MVHLHVPIVHLPNVGPHCPEYKTAFVDEAFWILSFGMLLYLTYDNSLWGNIYGNTVFA